MTKTDLDTLAVMAKQSSEIAAERIADTLRKEFGAETQDVRESLEKTMEVLANLADTVGDPEEYEKLFQSMTESTESAIKAAVESADALLSLKLTEELAKLKGELDEKARGIDAESAEATGTMRKTAGEVAILNESAASALLKLSEFQKQVSAEMTESLEKRLDETLELLRLENVVIRDDVRTEVNGLLANATSQVEGYLENLEIPDPIPGEPGEKGSTGEPGAPGRDGVDGAVGRTLPWQPDRFYQRHSTVTHLAGLWQARSPGEGEPGTSPQWDCLARGIINSSLNEAGELVVRYSDQTTQTIGDVRGPPGREWQHKGTFDPKAWYTRGDVVVVRGTSYVAIDDSPGDCPGEGWQMVAQAKNGPAGKRGPQGEPGDPGPPGTSIRWFGEYDSDTKYPDGAVVRAGKDLWVALDSTSEAPSPDAIDWDLMLPGGSA